MIRQLRGRAPDFGSAPVHDAVPTRKGEPLLPNALIVARREYGQRVRTRSFLFGTLFLILAAFAAALIPTIVTVFEGQLTTKVAVYSVGSDLATDPVAILEASLNGSVAAESGASASPTASPGTSATSLTRDASPGFSVSGVSDLAAARAALLAGTYDGLVVIARGAGGDVTFDYVSDVAPDGRVAFYIRQGATAITIKDRVDRLGLTADQATQLFAPVVFSVEPKDPAKPPPSTTSLVSRTLTSTILIVLILITVITYGTWVAMSVAEEKSSRVMELMLSAATPRQMLAGKVAGTGCAGLTQYAGLLVAGLIGIALQGPITAAILPGRPADGPSLAGMTPDVLVAFVLFFALGFALYALIYAAAGSLVSRQEEVQQVVTPLTFLAMAGYFVATFAASAGSSALWVVFFSYFPFTSPYVMLVRMVDGSVEPWEPLIAIAILIPTVLAMLVVATRVYSAGVLLYGQRPSLRTFVAAMRVPR